jgi:nucleoside-diphosphate-sugar epimerase
VVNVGSGGGTTIRELLAVIEAVTGRKPTIESVAARPFDVPDIVLDVSRLRRLIEFKPIGIIQGVKQTWDDMRGTA